MEVGGAQGRHQSAHLHGANLSEGRIGAGQGWSGVVVEAAHLDATALKFRQNIATGRAFLLSRGDVTRVPPNLPSGPQAAGLQASPDFS